MTARFAMERTCAECPWRKDVPVGRFPPERYAALAKTCEQDFHNPVFACHKSPEGREVACAGFLLVAGWENIRVRLAACSGAFDMAKIAADAPLYGTFAEMAAANGWRPDDRPPAHRPRSRAALRPDGLRRRNEHHKITATMNIPESCEMTEKALASAGISLVEFYREAGITKSTWWRWKRGMEPQLARWNAVEACATKLVQIGHVQQAKGNANGGLNEDKKAAGTKGTKAAGRSDRPRAARRRGRGAK